MKADPVQVLFDNFDTDNFSDNWRMENCKTGYSASSSTGRYSPYAYSGVYCFRFYYNTNPPQYLISTQELSIPDNALSATVSLYYKAAMTSYTETFCVGYSTDDNNKVSFEWLPEVSTNVTSYQYYSHAIPIGTKYIAIKYTANNQDYLYIDDIDVSYEPYAGCTTPTDLAATAVTPTSVSLGWTKGATESKWQVQYKKSSASEWTDLAGDVTATSNPRCTISDLDVNTAYDFRVRSKCGDEEFSDWSDSFSATPNPATPTDLTAAVASPTSLSLTWTKGQTAETAWQIQYRAKGAGSWNSPIDVTTDPELSLTGLTTNTTYEIQVRSYWSADEGMQSAWSSTLEATPIYAAPTNVLVAATDLGGDASWDVVSGATGYKYIVVAKDATPDWAEAKTGISVSGAIVHANPVLSGLHAKTNYDFYVRAVFAEGESEATKKSFITSSHTPSGLTKGVVTDSEATYSWSHNPNGAATRYQWACKLSTADAPADGEYTLLDDEVTSVTVTGLNASTNYKFYVRSYYEDGIYSSAVNDPFKTECGVIKTADLPWTSTFSSLECYPNAGTSDGAYSLSISSSELRFQGGSRYNTRYFVVALPEFEEDIQNLKISITYYTNGTTSNYPGFFIGYITDVDDLTGSYSDISGATKLQSNTSTTTDPVALSAVPNTAKRIAICYRTDGASSSYSSYGSSYISQIKVESLIDCSKPATPTYSDLTGNSVTVSWEPNENVTNYKYLNIDRTLNPTAELDWSGATAITGTSVNLSELTGGHNYEFYVMCACGTEASDPCSFTPTSCPDVETVTLSDELYNSVTVNWTTSGTTDCDVRYSIDGGSSWTSAATSVSGSSQAVLVSVGNTYTFAVKSSCGDTWVTCAETYAPVYPAMSTVSVGSINETSASASWADVTSADGYEYVIMSGTAEADWTSPTAATSPASLSELAAGTNYTLYVRAKFGEGRSAEASKNFTTTTVAPTGLTQGTTTTNSIAFSWSYTGAATQFQWKSSKEGSVWSDPISATNAEETGLAAGKTYTFYVRAYYSATVQSTELSGNFSTECGVNSLDWEETFGTSGTDKPNCWTIDKWGTSANNWTKASDFANTGVALKYNAKTFNSSDAISPSISITAPCELKFYIKNSVGSGSNKVECKVFINDGTTTTEIANITTRYTSATQLTYDLSGYVGKTVTIIFRGIGYDSSTTSTLWIDDVTVTAKELPACEAPTAVAVAPSVNSASITWTGNAKKLQYRVFKAAEPFNEWIDATGTIESPFALESLAADRKYDVRVQAECATADDYWSDAVSFTTWCDVKDASELPINITSFSAVPECWEATFKGEWSTVDGGQIIFYGTEEQWLVLPAYDINLNLLSVTFTFTPNGPTPEFGYLDEPNGTFHSFSSPLTSGVELNLENEDAAVKYIAVRYPGGSSEFAYLRISAVNVRRTPGCAKLDAPTATPGVGSASISWTAGSESAWNLQYKKASAALWTNATGEITNPFELNGLEQGVSYKVRVQADCGGGDLGDWSNETTFITNCDAIDVLPYFADFSVDLSNCWTIYAEDETWYKPMANTAMNQLKMDGGKNGASNNVVVLPLISADLSAAVLSLEYKNGSTGASYAQLEVGYMGDKADASSFTLLGTALEQSASWAEARVALNTVPANKHLALRFAGASSHSDMSIKNLRILEQLTLADNVDNTATLSANLGKAVDVTIGRTFVCAGYYNTICLPFSLSAAELAASPIASDDLWAFRYIKVDGDSLYIRIIPSETIEAGVPYLIAWPAGDNIANPLFKNVTISATEGKSVGDSDLKFVGILKPEPFAIGDKKKLFVAANNELYWWNGDHDSQLNSFRAFFYVNSGNGSLFHGMPARIVKDDKIATGVENVQGEGQAIKLLENNQVVIIRNGVKYTIQGQKIQ